MDDPLGIQQILGQTGSVLDVPDDHNYTITHHDDDGGNDHSGSYRTSKSEADSRKQRYHASLPPMDETYPRRSQQHLHGIRGGNTTQRTTTSGSLSRGHVTWAHRQTSGGGIPFREKRRASLSEYGSAEELGLTAEDYRHLLSKAEEVHRLLLERKKQDAEHIEGEGVLEKRKFYDREHGRRFERERYRLNQKMVPSDLREAADAKRCVKALQPQISRDIQNFVRQFTRHSRNKSRGTSHSDLQRPASAISRTNTTISKSMADSEVEHTDEDLRNIVSVNWEEATAASKETLQYHTLAKRDWRVRIWKLFMEDDKIEWLEKLFWLTYIFCQVSVRVAFHLALSHDQSGEQRGQWINAFELVLSDILYGDAYSAGMMLDLVVSKDLYDPETGSPLGSAVWDDKFKTVVVSERRYPSKTVAHSSLSEAKDTGRRSDEESKDSKPYQLADRIRTVRRSLSSATTQPKGGTFLTGTEISEQSASMIPHDATTRSQAVGEDKAPDMTSTGVPKGWPNLVKQEEQAARILSEYNHARSNKSYTEICNEWQQARQQRTKEFDQSKKALTGKLQEIKLKAEEELDEYEKEKEKTMKDSDKAHLLSMNLSYKRMKDFEDVNQRRLKSYPRFVRELLKRKENKRGALKSTEGQHISAVADEEKSNINFATRLSERVMRFTTQEAVSSEAKEERKRKKKAKELHKESLRMQRRREEFGKQLTSSTSAPSLSQLLPTESSGSYFTKSFSKLRTVTTETGRVEYEPDKEAYSENSDSESGSSSDSIGDEQIDWSKPIGAGERADFSHSGYGVDDSTVREQRRRRKQEQQEQRGARDQRQKQRQYKRLQLEAAAEGSDTLLPQTIMDSKKVWRRAEQATKAKTLKSGLTSWAKQMDTVANKTREAQQRGMSLPEVVLLEKCVSERRLQEHQTKVRKMEAESQHREFTSQKKSQMSLRASDETGITPMALSRRTHYLGRLSKKLQDHAKFLDVPASELHELPPAAMYPDITPVDAIT